MACSEHSALSLLSFYKFWVHVQMGHGTSLSVTFDSDTTRRRVNQTTTGATQGETRTGLSEAKRTLACRQYWQGILGRVNLRSG